MGRRLVFVLLAAAVALVALPLAPGLTASARPQIPSQSLPTILRRAALYAQDFRFQLAGIVTNETYVQDVDSYTRLRPEVTHRELKSDLLIVRAEDTGKFVEFRDVSEVDGRAVRDREERLTNLFVNPKGVVGQLQKIRDESARYNIGKVTRNVNTPTLPLLFLDAEYQPRFTFSIATDRTPSLANRGKAADTQSGRFTAPDDVVVIEFQESESKTIIRSPEGRNMPARGRFWIEPESGRLVMTELIAGDATIKATINVSYQSEPVAGLLMPVEMRERYEAANLVISGTATYGNFRRFEVHVNESTLK